MEVWHYTSFEASVIVSGKAALIIIFNEGKHAGNIPVLEEMYGGRFSHIYHLVPGFASSVHEAGPNVISVDGVHGYFQGYIAQGLRHYFREEYTHYLFIQDDLVLNPDINEDNFRDYLKLDREDAAFLLNLHSMHWQMDWPHAPGAYAFPGRVEPLPVYEEALEKFSTHGLDIKPLSLWLLLFHGHRIRPADSFLKKLVSPLRWLNVVRRRLQRFPAWPGDKRKLAYPLVSGFSDMVAVPAANIGEFCRYCKAFAESGLFVEIGLPTALALSCKKIKEQKDIPMQGRLFWDEEDKRRLGLKHGWKLDSLFSDHWDNRLFIHPVKLSQWNTDIGSVG